MAKIKIFLLDAHALCYRAFYAVKDLTDSKGQPTNAVFGFTKTVKKLLKDFQPEYIAVCFDVSKKTHRTEKYAQYKIQRPSMPDALKSQIPLIRDVVRGYQLPIFEKEGYEADDVIATIARKFEGKDTEVVVISDDKDFFQLVGPQVSVFSPRREQMITEAQVEDVLGVPPRQVCDLISLAGDKSDNIPGVAGIGAVSAKKLLKAYASLEEIFMHLDDVESASLRKKLAEHEQEAFLSKELAILSTDVPIEVELDDLKFFGPDQKKLFALFQSLEFHRMADEFSVQPHAQESAVKPVICEYQDFSGLGALARERKVCAVYWKPQEGEVSRCYVCVNNKIAVSKNLSDLAFLDSILRDCEIVKIVFDLKTQLRDRNCPLWQAENVFDLMLAGYVIDPVRSMSSLSSLTWTYLKRVLSSEADEAEHLKAAYDLYVPLQGALPENGADKLFYDLEMPLSVILAGMERDGVKLDVAFLGELSLEFQKKISAIEKELYDLAGEEFNLNSPKQLSHILFERLKLPVIKKTKTGYSTNEEVLNRLASRHPLPAKILEYRQLAKLKSTYIDALPELVDQKTGRLHASFNQTGTETGRLSSSNPNLQNIPIRAELGRQVRRAFIPLEEGHELLSADYSQIELRILAHLSEDENLIRAFKQGEDIHVYTAGLMFEVAVADVTREMRTAAKRVNFGIIFGISAFGLAKDLEVSHAQAQDFIDRYFLRYPKVKSFMDHAIESCEKLGYAETLLKRRRMIPEIHNPNMTVRQFAQRQAINAPVQGSAADLMKIAMIRIERGIQSRGLLSKMLITVHDELVFDMVPKEQAELVDLVRNEMVMALVLSVPIEVSVRKGKNWFDLEDVR